MTESVCDTCYQLPRDETRDDNQCKACGEYEDWYKSLTPEQKKAEHEVIALHCEEPQ